MNYIVTKKDGYIVSMQNNAPEALANATEYEYRAVLSALEGRPTPPDGYIYKLRTDLAWELVELPSAPAEPMAYTQESLEAMTNAELETILAGYGISASMNKANMVQLILLAQGGDSIG